MNAVLRVPPHSVEAEQSVIGSLLLDNTGWDALTDVVGPADFYRLEHRLAFEAIGVLVEASKPADVITVAELLDRQGHADDVGGMPYLNALAASVPSAANARHYGRIVRERAVHRALIHACDEVQAMAWRGEDVVVTMERATVLFDAMRGRHLRQLPKRLAELTVPMSNRLMELAETPRAAGWSTGLATLDRMLNGGLQPGRVYVLAARPSVGKSSFGQAIGLECASRGLPTLMLSQEMPESEVGIRAFSSLARVDVGAMMTGALGEADWSRISGAAHTVEKLPFFVDDQPALRLADIRAKARSVKGLRVLILDYLQLSAGSGRPGNRNAEIEEISRGLKALAKDLGVAVVELSQLNREVEKRPSKRPNLSDLRDSGAIEQDADVVMFLWPVRDFGDGRRVIGLAVEKNRQGRCGEFGLDFLGMHHRWRESTVDVRSYGGHGAEASEL